MLDLTCTWINSWIKQMSYIRAKNREVVWNTATCSITGEKTRAKDPPENIWNVLPRVSGTEVIKLPACVCVCVWGLHNSWWNWNHNFFFSGLDLRSWFSLRANGISPALLRFLGYGARVHNWSGTALWNVLANVLSDLSEPSRELTFRTMMSFSNRETSFHYTSS